LARRDITGAVDFTYLESFAAGDFGGIEEVLNLFREQATIWSRMLEPGNPGWRDAAHTIKGAARGIGANALADVCERAEAEGEGVLPAVHAALDAALMDIAAYQHELMLRSLKG
jgi:hypothetical protein